MADRSRLPAEGAITLLRLDPKTQGPLLFAWHCASCHSHATADGLGIVATEPPAPNLHGFGTTDWIAGLLDPERIASAEYFGRTTFVSGDMTPAVNDLFEGLGHEAAQQRRGDPIEASNVAVDDFEKSALKEIIAGKASVDRVVEKNGKRFLRTATAVPVVMTKCVACHPHYAKVPKGQAIGALVYTLPVE